MKLIAGIVAVALVACAGAASGAKRDKRDKHDKSGPVARCSVTDCFNESAIRSFDIIDDETAVVYVGPQHCPFLVSVEGFHCSLTVTPEIRFLRPLLGSTRATETTGQICGSRDTLYVYTGIVSPEIADDVDPFGRRPQYDTLGRRRDVFGEGVGSSRSPTSTDNTSVETVNNNDVCRVSEIRSITDDQLLELRVKRQGAAPPPPLGQGQVHVPGSASGAGQGASSQGQGAAGGAGQGSGAGQDDSGQGAQGSTAG
ncbi:MAG TPA: hypothetical protein VFV10_02085, partial [Gammaproteobacteria bacterium]|nr:hypothetical protein [Gammaproteobacteria bacterium]